MALIVKDIKGVYMLKKILKKGVSISCALVFALGVVGCANTESEWDAEYEVWTTYNTTKVLQDVQFNERYEKMEKEERNYH